jgi:hypothetical protein
MPAFGAPTLRDAVAFKHEMGAAALAEHVAHDQPGLPATDDQRLHALIR